MKLAVLVLVLVAACPAGGSDDYPTRPGGGGPVVVGPGGGGDAGTGDGGAGDAGAQLTGRVCVLTTDMRALGNASSCAVTGAKNLRVSLGNKTTTTTTDDGKFAIDAPVGGGFTWHVTGNVADRIVTSAMPFGADNTIPAVTTMLYNDLLLANSVAITDQEGSIVVRVVSGAAAAANVSATSNPAANNLAFYDSLNSRQDWDSDVTKKAGIVWFPGVPLSPAPATVVLTPQGGTGVNLTVTVENQVITFVTKDLQ